ncbi:HpcH/HpaI aldolase family protein [Amycolatopsis jejuensis]|uniref:HpcH/HpaI aldolase family protein n=1 Tax=Amycolatopsis jejuensis TaxID=330084 RepID=UPI00052678AE|nr:aldolase/citrate lyase family protein [Amycolatopsis jejuensis]
MTTNLVRERWTGHEVAFGTLLGIPAVSSAYALGGAGYDWVVIEQQHAYVSQEETLPLLHALELGGTTPFVRVGENDPIGIQRALDLGARGIVAPMVNTPEQAELVRVNTRFPPLGERSWGIPRHHGSPAEANEDVVVMLMIETPAGVSNIEAILSVHGIDGIVFGPGDMAMNVGVAPQIGAKDEKVWEAFEIVGDACKRHGKHYGSFVADQAIARRMVAHGADFVLFSSDLGHVAAGVAADAEAIAHLRKERR